MMAMTASEARRLFAEEIRVAAGIVSPQIVDALANIPRERYLPPGPWQIRGMGDVGGPPRQTEDADPTRVYHDVSIALDSARNLYNGQPGLIARWLDVLEIQPDDRAVHIGCGTGYFTALMAHVVGPGGRVQAIEVEPDLAARAGDNLSNQPWVDVRHGNGASGLMSGATRILVHAGATHVLDAWLDALAEGGRLLLPLTAEFPGMPAGIGKGTMLLVTREDSQWHARLCGAMPVAIYSLKELRDEGSSTSLARALTQGTLVQATRVRRDAHDPTGSCIVHGPTNCLSS
jgi:protein-L-isoaspartate(D-aspartate) O-methyltransferase